MPDERKTEDTTSPPKTHEVAPVVNNEITADREANDAASPTKVDIYIVNYNDISIYMAVGTGGLGG